MWWVGEWRLPAPMQWLGGSRPADQLAAPSQPASRRTPLPLPGAGGWPPLHRIRAACACWSRGVYLACSCKVVGAACWLSKSATSSYLAGAGLSGQLAAARRRRASRAVLSRLAALHAGCSDARQQLSRSTLCHDDLVVAANRTGHGLSAPAGPAGCGTVITPGWLGVSCRSDVRSRPGGSWPL